VVFADELDTPLLEDSDEELGAVVAVVAELASSPSDVVLVAFVVRDADAVVVAAPWAASPANSPVAPAAAAATQRVMRPTRRRPASRSALLRGGMRFVVMTPRIAPAHVCSVRDG
jgi:hypothetical protein